MAPRRHTFQERLDKALACKNEERYQECIEILEELKEEEPQEPVVTGLLGACLSQIGSFDKALPVLIHSVRLSPKSEVTSRALFHTLWALDNHEQALEEIKRFYRTTGRMLEDCKHILKELCDE